MSSARLNVVDILHLTTFLLILVSETCVSETCVSETYALLAIVSETYA